MFMDAFQGSYRIEPYDLRYFSGFYILLRFLIVFTSMTTGSIFYMPLTATILILGALPFLMFEPYKNRLHNKLDIFLILFLALVFVEFVTNFITYLLDPLWLPTANGLLLGLPLMLITVYFLIVCVPQRTLVLKLLKWMREKLKGNYMLEKSTGVIRNLFQDEYCPLLHQGTE